ncbi:MAG: ABC transporter substrate-binding protein, partial [Thermoleophilaceae bacterium]
AVALALACGGGLAACSLGGGEEGADKNTLVIALPAEPENLNPIFGDNIYAGNEKFFNGLLRYGEGIATEPDLAAALPKVSGDRKTVTVRIREGVRFHDGKPLTADDAVFTYRSMLDPKVASPFRTQLESLRGVEAVGRDTVRFSLKRPDPAFPDKLQMGIIPAHLLEGKDLNKTSFNKRPVGTGPYKFKELRAGQRMVMEANRDYFDGPPNIKRVVYTFVEDENARASMLANGSIDGAGLVPKLAPRFRDSDDYRVIEVPSTDARTIALGNQNPALSDPRVRRALSRALDRAKIVKGVLAGAGEPAYGPAMPRLGLSDSIAKVPHDPAGARRLLGEAGWRDTNGDDVADKGGRELSFTIMYFAGDSVRRDIGLAVRSDLAKVGVDAKVAGVGDDVVKARAKRDATVFGWGVPYDPDLELYSLYNSSLARDDDPYTNSPLMKSRTVDAALESGRAGSDRGERRRSYRKLLEGLRDDGSWLYVARLKHIVVLSKRVSGVKPQLEPHAHGFSRGTSWNMERWKLAPGG